MAIIAFICELARLLEHTVQHIFISLSGKYCGTHFLSVYHGQYKLFSKSSAIIPIIASVEGVTDILVTSPFVFYLFNNKHTNFLVVSPTAGNLSGVTLINRDVTPSFLCLLQWGLVRCDTNKP